MQCFARPESRSGLQLNDSGIVSERSRGRPSRRTSQTGKIATPLDAIIPCGLCVEVEPWERDPNSQDQPSFARLCGGQGWIPRHMNGQVFTRTVEPPSIRNGSIWFRVKSKRGIKVRHGPSRRASSIKNEEGEYFRFECGEFLRASEVHTMRSDEDVQTIRRQANRTRRIMVSNALQSCIEIAMYGYRHRRY